MFKKLKTLRVKFAVITFTTYLFLVVSVIQACYLQFLDKAITDHVELGNEILNMASSELNVDNFNDYLNYNYDADEYLKQKHELDKYASSFKEVYYLYIIKASNSQDTAKYIFDARVDHDTPAVLGEEYPLEEDLLANINKMRAGSQIEPLRDNTQRGYLLTVSKPLIDSQGQCQGCILIDFNLTDVVKDVKDFMIILFIFIFFIMTIIFAAGMLAVSKRITKPIEKMYTCLSEFKYDTEQDRKANIQSLMDLNIHTNTEIQSLYNILIETAKNSFIYQHDLEVASQALDTMEEMVYVDSLTGLGNKYGCDEKIKEIQKRIDAGKNIDFAVIMADINNLKYVNDNFGHDKGDKYIIGCTKILSKYFSPNNIFRLGGDEFIIFVENRDYLIKDSLLKKAIDDFASLENNEAKQPHHRYSMSLGMSDFKTDFNLSVVETMQKADAKMYEAKVKHKELYGSYR